MNLSYFLSFLYKLGKSTVSETGSIGFLVPTCKLSSELWNSSILRLQFRIGKRFLNHGKGKLIFFAPHPSNGRVIYELKTLQAKDER